MLEPSARLRTQLDEEWLAEVLGQRTRQGAPATQLVDPVQTARNRGVASLARAMVPGDRPRGSRGTRSGGLARRPA